MLVSDFDYHLPPELIAQEPLADRAASRLLHLVHDVGAPPFAPAKGGISRGRSSFPERSEAKSGVADRLFYEFPELLRPGDLVVFNNTRVFPARLFGHRSGARAQPVSARNRASRDFLRGRVEVLLTRQVAGGDQPEWETLVRPGRKIGIGERLYFGEHDELQAEVIGRGEFGERRLRFAPVEDFFGDIERIGHVPLPPYIGRADEPGDRERYQTVYARERGSVAAPTAGLHFTPEILARMRERGIETAEVTLHVGLGTFQPVHAERVEEHHVHREWYSITDQAALAINRALDAGRRVVAVGTTTVRTVEHAGGSGRLYAGQNEAELFIYPGYQFRMVGALLTNFHLPKSTLLMLVAAFAGRERALAAYEHAIRERYRFYSYGDCMFIE